MTLITDPKSGAPGSQDQPGQVTPGQSGSQEPKPYDFRALLPEDIRNEKSFDPFSKVKDHTDFVQQMARSFHSAQGMIGKKGLQVPGDDATPEQIAEFRKAIGVPEKEDEYQFDIKEEMKKSINEDKIKQWRATFKEIGIPRKEANKLVGRFLEEQAAEQAMVQKQIKEWETETVSTLGANLDKTINEAQYALREVDKDGKLAQILESTGLGSSLPMLRVLSTLGQALAEHGPRGEGASVVTNLSPDQAQAELQQFDRNQREVLLDPRHKDHDMVVKRRLELFMAAFPSKG